MRIELTTRVDAPYEAVVAGFDRSLFLALNPPFPRVTLERFDGCRTGDEVHLRMHFGVFQQRWESVITDHGEDSGGSYFVDEGHVLPFFLKRWRHYHGIERVENGTLLRDRIDFESPWRPLDLVLYPALLGQFLYRKPVYRRRFRVDRR